MNSDRLSRDRRRLTLLCSSTPRAILAFWLVFSLGTVQVPRAEPLFATESQIKAAYLLRFAQFVEWPDSSLGVDAKPLTIGVLGRDPFGDVLEHTLSGRQARGREVRVRIMTSPEDTSDVNLVYFGAMPRAARRQALALLGGRPVLTVGESREFLDDGGAIALVRVADRVRFTINLDATRPAHLKISARILQLAEAVRGEL
jgi:hypothetical protein